jgi:hypothetical protein
LGNRGFRSLLRWSKNVHPCLTARSRTVVPSSKRKKQSQGNCYLLFSAMLSNISTRKKDRRAIHRHRQYAVATAERCVLLASTRPHIELNKMPIPLQADPDHDEFIVSLRFHPLKTTLLCVDRFPAEIDPKYQNIRTSTVLSS